MKRRGVVQADEPAQIGKPDPFAMTRDLFEDRKGAAERLDADPLPVVGVVVDVVLRRRCTSLAMAAFRGPRRLLAWSFAFDAFSQGWALLAAV